MQLNSDLSEFFITRNQANDFIQSLNNIIDKLYEVDFNLENSLINEFGIDKKDKFMNYLRDNKIKNSSNDELKKFLQNLQNDIRRIPVLTLNIAFEPNETTLKALIQWFLFTLNKQVLIDFIIDKKIIAGASINFNGKFKDYSVKTLFDNIIIQKLNPTSLEKNKFPNSIRTN